MRRRENIYYVIEALADLGGVGDPEDVYNKAGELFPRSIIKSYPDAGAFDEVVCKAVDDCLDSAAGKKVFRLKSFPHFLLKIRRGQSFSPRFSRVFNIIVENL